MNQQTTGTALAVVRDPEMKWLDIPRQQLRVTLGTSLYPGAKPESVDMVLDYCEAAGLNVMLKPVHIVPMFVKGAGNNSGTMRDVVMPGINHYRTQAARSGVYLGKSEPEFGPMIERSWGTGQAAKVVQFPEWCRITVKRRIGDHIAEFTATEYWEENFADAGRDKPWPNTMWAKRPRGQLAKCTEAQALRMGFPELTGDATAEEMEGKVIEATAVRGDGSVRPGAAKSLDHFSGRAAVEEAQVEELRAEPEAAAEESKPKAKAAGKAKAAEPTAGTIDVVPDMPGEASNAWETEGHWALGWRWLNETMPGLTPDARQKLADVHAGLLWAVFKSDRDGKKVGPQSKAVEEFVSAMGVTVKPEVAVGAEA